MQSPMEVLGHMERIGLKYLLRYTEEMAYIRAAVVPPLLMLVRSDIAYTPEVEVRLLLFFVHCGVPGFRAPKLVQLPPSRPSLQDVSMPRRRLGSDLSAGSDARRTAHLAAMHVHSLVDCADSPECVPDQPRLQHLEPRQEMVMRSKSCLDVVCPRVMSVGLLAIACGLGSGFGYEKAVWRGWIDDREHWGCI